MSIVNKLPSLRTSQEFSAALDQIQFEIDSTDAAVTALKAQRSKAAFDASPDAVRAIQRQILEKETDVELLSGLLTEAETRRRAAESSEIEAALLQRSQRARKHWEDARNLYITIDEFPRI